MSGFSPEWKEELKSRNDIVSTISHYITLKRKGKNYWGICPFHYEKTPSFCVNSADQFYKCFGCGESGDVISFVQKYEGIDFVDAVQILAKNSGMEMPEFENSENIKKQKEEREKILQALRQAAIFYHKCLNSSVGLECRKYLEKRGVTKSSITTFGIGFSPNFDIMRTELLKQGFSIDILRKAGLVDTTGKDGDFYAKRLIFPLINIYGEVVGFSGRILDNQSFAKYKNTPQTPVFDKSKVVFGINLIKKLRNELHSNVPYIILVEGQLDVVSMHQAGFKNTVACLGTALTPLHTKELKKLTDNVIILLDGDSAGQKATLRSLEVLKPSGLSVKVATLKDGLDPDEFLKKYSKEEMQKLLDSAVEAIDFQITSLAKNFDLSSNEQKTKFIRQALVIIKGLDTDAEKTIYLEMLRKLTNIPVDILRQDLQNTKISNEDEQKNFEEKTKIFSEEKQDAFMKADKFILASLLYRKSWAKIEECKEVSFLLPDANTLFEYVKTSTPERPAIVSGVFDRIDVEKSPFVQSVINCTFNEETAFDVWKDCLIKNQERKILIEKDKLEKSFPSLNVEERKQVANKLFELDLKLAKLKNKSPF